MTTKSETTDLTVFVHTSDEAIIRWDRQRIVDALLREAAIHSDLAVQISKEVENQIMASGIRAVTTSLIREMVNVRLIERGLEKERRLHGRLGFPLYDVRQLMLYPNKRDANIPHSPEGTNLLFAEGIKRELSLYDVFSDDLREAHITGDFHIHGLGYIDRPYSCSQSLEYLKIHGLHLPQAVNSASPAKYAEVLLAHMVRFSAVLQGHFASTISWDAVNISFAPYLTAMTDKEVEQFAQMLIYEFSQLSATRGGQALYTDIHIYYDMPPLWADLPAIGPEGKPTGKTYRDYLQDAQRFARSILVIFAQGDAQGKPFVFPRPLVHITGSLWKRKDSREFLLFACDVAARMGTPCFVFDRNEFTSPFLESNEKNKPWLHRIAVIQPVTLNLPRLGYQSEGNDTKLFSLISALLEKVGRAHLQKKDFLERLLSFAEDGPLAVLAMCWDEYPFLRMNIARYVIGIAGLNELVAIHTGREMHQTRESLEFGLKIIDFLHQEIRRLGQKLKLNMILGQAQAETTTYRFARLDLRYFSPRAGHYVQGDLSEGAVYYTNSACLNVAADISPLLRVQHEGRFHPYFEEEVFTHIQLGDTWPEKERLYAFISKAYLDSENRQIHFNPEFTFCRSCAKTFRGLHKKCPNCQSSETEGIARLTKCFSKISGWNKGKLAELKDRKSHEDFGL